MCIRDRGYEVQNIVQGVETDADGMVTAYWICNRHPLGSNSAVDAACLLYTSGNGISCRQRYLGEDRLEHKLEQRQHMEAGYKDRH